MVITHPRPPMSLPTVRSAVVQVGQWVAEDTERRLKVEPAVVPVPKKTGPVPKSFKAHGSDKFSLFRPRRRVLGDFFPVKKALSPVISSAIRQCPRRK
jgi:hypothetical protein